MYSDTKIKIIDTKQLRDTVHYLWFSNCPKQAITLIGKEVYEQCRIEKYIDKTDKHK